MSSTLIAVGVAIGSAVMMYLFGYRKAGQVHKTKETEQRLEDIKEAQEVHNEVEKMDDDELAARAARWMRKRVD
jgi:hypothetical protein